MAYINTGSSTGEILSPVLNKIYASDQPTSPSKTVAEFSDVKAIISVYNDPITTSSDLPNHLKLIFTRYKNGALKSTPSNQLILHSLYVYHPSCDILRQYLNPFNPNC